ncbi:MAG: glycosyltransferase [Ilumatobacteraceae bacterium]
MTPGEASTDRSSRTPTALFVAPTVTSPGVRSGAGLGPWRTALGAAAGLLGLRYVIWQTTISPDSLVGHAFTVCEVVAVTVFLMTLSVLMDRGRRPGPVAASGSLDVFITVCGEPVHVVEAAIRTALAIDYPHRTVVLNDGRIAGKSDWRAIELLGARLGVDVLTRASGAKGKAGNLNHGLASSTADFVVTIDGDHRAEPDLGHRLLRSFNESKVAFVAAAQRFDLDADVLNNRQPFFFQWLQPAKDAAGCAISCGSGVAYRRAALDDIGGFSEWNIVEDLHTSYRLHAAGWTSVYEREPVTTGLAPSTAAEYAHQRGRWALDTMRILFFDSPLRRAGLSRRVRWHYLHTTTSYLLAVPMALFLVGAPLYVLTRIHVAGGVSGRQYIAYAVPYLIALLAFFASMVGVRGALVTFRSTIFDAWITVLAIVKALSGVRRSGVTNKTGQRRVTWLLAPQLVALTGLIVALVVAVVDRRPGTSVIAVTWVAINALALAGPLSAFSERRRSLRRSRVTTQAAVLLLGVAGIAVTATSASFGSSNVPLADPTGTSPIEFAVPAPVVSSAATRPAASPPPASGAVAPSATAAPSVPATQPATTPAGPRKLMVPTVGAYFGVASEGMQSEPAGARGWTDAHGGARPAIVSWYQHWGSGENRFREDWVRNVADQGAVPMITWEPWAKPDGEYADPNQEDFRLERIIAGEFDTYVTAWAQAAAAHQGPIIIRFMHEFNGEWYPWSIGQQGQTAEQYVAAWRHVHDIFQQAGATNVSWVWSVIGAYADPQPAYPGDDVVDWVAATVLNSAWPEFGGWFDYGTLSARTYAELSAYDKPIMMSEVATNNAPGDPAAWLTDMFATVEVEQPLVRAVVLFDMPYDDRTDYHLTDAAAAAVATSTRGGWFAPALEIGPPP